MSAQMEKVYSRITSKGNLRMWGKLYVKRWEQAVVGWLVDSWSENGAPYWRPRMHWLDKKENKLQKAYLNFETGAMELVEDSEVEPDRAKFIRETVEQWETEWLQEQQASIEG